MIIECEEERIKYLESQVLELKLAYESMRDQRDSFFYQLNQSLDNLSELKKMVDKL